MGFNGARNLGFEIPDENKKFLFLENLKSNFSFMNHSGKLVPMGNYFARAAFCLVFGFVFVSCQSSPVKVFDEEIKKGMDKNQVLHIMGTPNTSGRFHGKDRWIYVMYEGDTRHRKEVHFSDGFAVYVGNEFQPPKDSQANIVDQVNLEQEVVLQAEEKQRAKDIGNQLNKFEDDIKGKNSVIYVDQFEPIK